MELISFPNPDSSMCGQIFRKNNGALLFVCIHCTISEFDSLIEYSVHINTHYTIPTIFQEFKIPKEEELQHRYSDDNCIDEPVEVKSEFDQSKDDVLEPEPKTDCTTSYNKLEPECKITIFDEKPLPLSNKKSPKQSLTAKYTCDYCNFNIRLKADLIKHMKEKHFVPRVKKVRSDNSGVCSLCGKFYVNASSLREHHLTHTNTRPFPCKFCDLRFFSNKQVQVHTMRKHTMERPHQCQICGKRFVIPYELKTHMICHTGQKDAQCKICLRFFRDKKRLKQHSVVHTGAKPHKCRHCDLMFGFFSSRRIHEKQVHNG